MRQVQLPVNTSGIDYVVVKSAQAWQPTDSADAAARRRQAELSDIERHLSASSGGAARLKAGNKAAKALGGRGASVPRMGGGGIYDGGEDGGGGASMSKELPPSSSRMDPAASGASTPGNSSSSSLPHHHHHRQQGTKKPPPSSSSPTPGQQQQQQHQEQYRHTEVATPGGAKAAVQDIWTSAP